MGKCLFFHSNGIAKLNEDNLKHLELWRNHVLFKICSYLPTERPDLDPD